MAEGGAAAVFEALSAEPAAAALCIVPGQALAFPFDVGNEGESRMFPGVLADHVRADAPGLGLLLKEGVSSGGIWMVDYEDGDLEAVRAEHVPAGAADHQRYMLDGAASEEEIEREGEGADEDDGGAPQAVLS